MNERNMTKVQHEEADKRKQSKTMKIIELNWKTRKRKRKKQIGERIARKYNIRKLTNENKRKKGR